MRAGCGEYLAQGFGGIPMSQTEFVRLPALGLSEERIEARRIPAVRALIADGTSAELRARLVETIAAQEGTSSVGDPGLDDTLTAMRSEMHRFAEAEVVPHAQGWHLKNEYIRCWSRKMPARRFASPSRRIRRVSRKDKCAWCRRAVAGLIGVGSLGTPPSRGGNDPGRGTQAQKQNGCRSWRRGNLRRVSLNQCGSISPREDARGAHPRGDVYR